MIWPRNFETQESLLNYLHNLCHNFKPGQVAANFAAWKELTTVQHRLPAQTFSEHEYVLVCEEIHKLLQKGVITKVGYKPGQIVSSIFLRPKKDGAYRLILNLKKFNESVTHHHFKMDSLHTITKWPHGLY